MLRDSSLSEFASALESSEPAPGGGSASAAVAAVGTSLLAMTCIFTIGKERFKDAEADLTAALEELAPLRVWFLASVDRDSEAYGAVVEAFRMPKGTDGERKVRRKAIQAAFRAATEVPLDVARRCARTLDLAVLVARRGNPNTITDTGCGARFLEAALNGALYNVRVNLSSIKDEAFVETVSAEVAELRARASASLANVDALVKDGLEG